MKAHAELSHMRCARREYLGARHEAARAWPAFAMAHRHIKASMECAACVLRNVAPDIEAFLAQTCHAYVRKSLGHELGAMQQSCNSLTSCVSCCIESFKASTCSSHAAGKWAGGSSQHLQGHLLVPRTCLRVLHMLPPAHSTLRAKHAPSATAISSSEYFNEPLPCPVTCI